MPVALLVLIAAPACDPEPERPPASALLWLRVELPAGVDAAAAEPRLVPAPPVRRRVRSGGAWLLGIEPEEVPDRMRVEMEGACPLELSFDDATADTVVMVEPKAWLEADEPVAQVGFDAPFRIELRPGCRDAVAGQVEWEQVSGPRAQALRTDKRGFVLHGRSPTFDAIRGDEPLPWGIVPMSPHSRGSMVFQATWRRGASGPPVRRRVRVAAAARSSGLPSISVGARVWLGGDGWHVAEGAPEGAVRQEGPGRSSFLAGRSGTWTLRDGADRDLLVRVGRHDETPLDCGRSECHGAESRAVRTSPMTTVLARALGGDRGEGQDAECALPCHAVGEPGLPDGGFAHVARELGFRWSHASGWNDLPVHLQRLGGVGCTACHGPGAIPAPESRWAILRADVCAVCHDGPGDRYGHVRAWRSSSMARTDARAGVRAPECRTCHTTPGFLAHIGARTPDVRVPEGSGPVGIACAACHAPHDMGSGPALVRNVSLAGALKGEDAHTPPSTRICMRCHGADDTTGGTQALLWFGRGGLDPERGEPLEDTPSPHRGIDGGCVGCHRGGPRSLERGAGHAFSVAEDSCIPCHERRPAPGDDLAVRARRLWQRLVAEGAVELDQSGGRRSPHAVGARIVEPDSPLGRAAHDVRLVVEDRAAPFHNGSFARRLLDEAERALQR